MRDKIYSDRQLFIKRLDGIRKELAESIRFYPYPILSCLGHLDSMLQSQGLVAEDILLAETVNDIGGSDGDLSFYCEFLGAKKVNLIDCNGLVAARKLKEALDSHVNLIDADVDTRDGWDRVEKVRTNIFLGILYHLQNPFYALAQLAKKSRYLILSTRVFDAVGGRDVSSSSCAYFYESCESNNDPTNWWCFTEECLHRMFKRSGWKVIAYKRLGCLKNANPLDNSRDGRVFAYLESKEEP